MTGPAVPSEAVEAAAKAYRAVVLGGHNSVSTWEDYAEPCAAALAAAMPAIRQQIADEIDDYAKAQADAYDPEVMPLRADLREWWHVGMNSAAFVARGGSDAGL